MSKLQLSFEISENFGSVAKIESGKVTLIDSFFFEDKKDFQYKDRLAKCLIDNGLEHLSPDEITVSWIDVHATLVPMNVFKPELLDDFFSACFNKKVKHNDIDYNRIFSHSLVNIYEIPLWVKSFFVLRYPRVNIMHIYSHLIKANNQSITAPPEIHCLIYPESMFLMLSKAGNIIFCNTFEINQMEDILYYLSFTLQKQELVFEQSKMTFSIAAKVEFLNSEIFSKEMKQMSNLKNIKLHFEDHYSFKIQEFCV